MKEWQVQIYVDEVDEWYGWAHTDYDSSCKADAERAERIAKQRGWTTRLVQVEAEPV